MVRQPAHFEGTPSAADIEVRDRLIFEVGGLAVVADRPFLWAIVHQDTGAILFVGPWSTPPHDQHRLG